VEKSKEARLNGVENLWENKGHKKLINPAPFFCGVLNPTQKKKPPNPRSKLRGFKEVLDKTHGFFRFPLLFF